MSGRGPDTKPRQRRPSIPIDVRLWPKINKEGPIPAFRPDLGPCWIWTGARHRHSGYGYFGVAKGDIRVAHRVVYEILVGPIPDGLDLDHLCRVTSCCNPSHLEPVTGAENVRRAYAAKGECRRGHPFSDATHHEYKGWRVCKACVQENNRNLVKKRTAARKAAKLATPEPAEMRGEHIP